MKINTLPNAFQGRRAAAFRAFLAIGFPIRLRALTLPVALIAVAGTSASVRAEDIESASASRLASISLPSGAARIGERSVPEEITNALRKLIEAGGSKVKQGKTEVLAWTANDFKKIGVNMLKSRIGSSLKSAGWTYTEEKIEDKAGPLTLVTVIRTEPPKRALVGFWGQSDEALVLAWTEMLPAGADSTEPSSDERSIKGIVDGLKAPHVVTPPVPEDDKPKPANDEPTQPAARASQAGTSTASAINITLAPSQTHVNVMKNASLPLPTFPKVAPKPGIVRGYVKDGKGRPLKGAVIGVRSSAAGGFYSGASGKSDEKGYHEVTVPWRAAEFYTASVPVDYGEGRAAMGLHPADGEADSFASVKGLVENWVLLPYGIADRDGVQDKPWYSGNYFGGSFTLDYSVTDSRFPDDYTLPDGAEIEVTLTPDGPLVDGNPGKSIIIRRTVREDAPKLCYINNIPVGVYRITARLLQNGNAAPLRLKETGPYASPSFGLEPKEARGSATLTFRPGSAKAGSGSAAHGNWGSLSITLYR